VRRFLVTTDIEEKTPDLTLRSDSLENKVSLEETRQEGPIVLFYYLSDWSSECTDEMGQPQQQLGHFEEKGARVLGLSVDSPWTHQAWAEERGLGFPLLSGFGREVLEKYGVKHEAGFPERASFVIAQEGVVQAKKVEDSPGDQLEVEKVIEDLEKVL
jgi:peroxiredoxin